MPKRPSNAIAWYYEDFLPVVQDVDLHEDQAADWKRLRIWDGNELKPALPEGFRGRPSEAQIENLFEAMKQGNLFLFGLGELDPTRIDYGIHKTFPVDPKEPDPPEEIPPRPEKPTVPDPGDYRNRNLQLTDAQRQDYAVQWKHYNSEEQNWQNIYLNRNHSQNRYQIQLKAFEERKAFLEAVGDGYRNSVNKINEERAPGMEQEKKLQEARNANEKHLEFQRKRGSMDDVITNMMAPRPVAVPSVFFGADENVPAEKHPAPATTDATFSYKTYDTVLDANGYDLPPNDKITEYDAATIHMMIMGAGNHMAQYTLNHMELGGPVMSRANALDGFNMLMTGMFGINRKHQPCAEHMGEALRVGKAVIGKYIHENDPKPLGDMLADSFRSLQEALSSTSQIDLTADTVALTKVVERMLKLLDTHPDLMVAAGLQQQELKFMRGYVKLGEVYDKYLDSQMKLNEAAALEKPLSAEEKKQILADIAIREMISAQMKKEVDAFTATPEYLQKAQEASEQDARQAEVQAQWLKDNGYSDNPTNALAGKNEFEKHHDAVGAYTLQLNTQPFERKIINWVGEADNYEMLYQNLLNDPALNQLAQMSEAELKELVNSGDGVKQLAEMGQKAQNMVIDAPVWYASLKSQMLGGRPEHDTNAVSPWINANVPTDAERLLIAVDNGDGTKRLATVASLLANGLEDLRDPSAATMEMLYQNALEGNLYYYDVGKDMPMRLSAEGQEPRLSQMEFHQAPTFWMRVANFLTFGYAYADIIHPQADRDPAAYDAFVQARGARGKAAQDEVASRHDQARSSNQKGVSERFEQESNFIRFHTNDKAVYPTYADNAIQQKLAYVLMSDYYLMSDAVAQLNKLAAREAHTVIGQPNVEPDKIREIMAMMVLVEAAKQEKALSEDDQLGPFAQKIQEDPTAAINAMKQDKIFQKFTPNVSMDMFKHFLMVDGAKNMYKAMQQAAVEQGVKQGKGMEGNEVNLEHQNDRDPISNTRNMF